MYLFRGHTLLLPTLEGRLWHCLHRRYFSHWSRRKSLLGALWRGRRRGHSPASPSPYWVPRLEAGAMEGIQKKSHTWSLLSRSLRPTCDFPPAVSPLYAATLLLAPGQASPASPPSLVNKRLYKVPSQQSDPSPPPTPT